MKPTLKLPRTKRLKPEHGNMLSNFAFNFKLRRYSKAAMNLLATMLAMNPFGHQLVGRCRLTLSNPSSNRLELSA
jgi:hypothetical protein